MIGTPIRAPGMPHRRAKKNTANTTASGEIESAAPAASGTKIVADEELDGGEPGEDEYDRLPGIELSDGEERWQERRNEGTDERDDKMSAKPRIPDLQHLHLPAGEPLAARR